MTSKLNEAEHGVAEDGLETGSLGEEIESFSDPVAEDDGTATPRNFEDLLEESRNQDDAAVELPTFAGGYSRARRLSSEDSASLDHQDSVVPSIERDFGSPDGSISIPDDTPSLQSSAPSSPGRGLPQSRKPIRPSLSPSPQSFERRFQARVTSSPLASPRPLSPAFLNARSRQSSATSQLVQNLQEQEEQEEQSPWEVVRWTKLKKITSQAFSEAGRRAFGRPTYFTIAASIIVGTSKGIVLAFDYQQTLKGIIGQGTKATEAGSITALALSADHSTIVSGHADGSIFTWDLSHPAKPVLHIPPLPSDVDTRKSDGHISGLAVLHVGFLGNQRMAIVSADKSGMAFSHVASRGLSVIGRNINTTRILGRYPETKGSATPRKPSSVLAFSPLPLGNVQQATDDMGLTALLTPFLLVIVSTTPIAQTQFKVPRAKEVAPHSALSGCLAWFPAVKLRGYKAGSNQNVSKTKLVYCWSNILTILELDVSEIQGAENGPNLHFRPRSRWQADEAIVAVQWLSRSIIALMTITQKLIILEDNSLRVADTSDLIQKHIYRQDLYSRQLQPVVDQLENDISMHGVIADAFHMSFRAYKGRLFILGANDVSMGTLSNWADRLMTLVEAGNFIAAIQLATAYYNGDTDKLTVGLPDDDETRHSMVAERLVEMMSASLKFTFKDVEPGNIDKEMQSQLMNLVTDCFAACASLQDFDFLFEEVYEWYNNAYVSELFFEVLEGYILNDTISALPPDIFQDMINFFASRGYAARLENIILRLDTSMMDIDQVTAICKRHKLYDAFIFVWNHALSDYITPLVELLGIVRQHLTAMQDPADDVSIDLEPAQKLFPYLAYTLTGRTYPNGSDIADHDTMNAKADLYGFLFSEEVVKWPMEQGDLFRTAPGKDSEPTYPYLRMLLHFDSESFLSMLNEAFVDSFLNEGQDQLTNGAASHGGIIRRTGLSMNRQRIVNILLGIMTPPDFARGDTIFLDMFISRNLAKFSSFVLLRGSTLQEILTNLCNYPTEDLADECQLSAEYLLSVYHPADLQSLIPLFTQAGFYRILKSTYKSSQQYSKWLKAHFEDPIDRMAVFDCIRECLRPGSRLSARQSKEVKAMIVEHAKELVHLDSARSAICLRQYAPDLLAETFNSLDEDSQARYEFLKELFEPAQLELSEGLELSASFQSSYTEEYVKLMCNFDRRHVADYIESLESSDLHLSEVLPAMEASGVVDAAVVLLARDGLTRDAMTRLLKHLGTLQTALVGLLTVATESPDVANTNEAGEDLVEAIQKYVRLGVWLCQGQQSTIQATRPARQSTRSSDLAVTESDLTPDELLWLDLLDAVVNLSRSVTNAMLPPSTGEILGAPDSFRAGDTLRTIVQQTFTALLASTTAMTKLPPKSSAIAVSNTHATDQSFLRILRTFLDRASKAYPSLSSLRAVLADIFAAYTFEESILSLSNAFLDKDVFVHVEEATKARARGWRPRSQICEWCKKRAWGPGAGVEIWEAWRRKKEAAEEKKGRESIERAGGEAGRVMERGKGRASERDGGGDGAGGADGAEGREDKGPLMVFSCSHLYHQRCYEQAAREKTGLQEEQEEVTCPLCI